MRFTSRVVAIVGGVGLCCFLLLLSGIQYTGRYQDTLPCFGRVTADILAANQPNSSVMATVMVPNTRKSQKIGIVVVSDKQYQAKQEPLYETHRQYASHHGYDYHVLEPNPSCRQVLVHFFFIKHCTVRKFLATQEKDYTLFVVDGDVIVAAPEVGLDRWTNQSADVLLYEREWNFELTAGNYMVRNSPFGKQFLRTWELFDHRARDIRGFSSYDNGALHLAVLQVLDTIIPFEEYEACDRSYQLLENRDAKNLTEYYTFVACTRRVLGPNRIWEVTSGGSLSVVHRYHGFSVDYFISDGRPGGGIPFYHGDKDPAKALARFKRTTPWKSAEEQSLAINEKHWLATEATPFWDLVPRINLTLCLCNFSCQPASMYGAPSRDFYLRHNRTRVFDYYSMRQDLVET